jgi:hypothetical protein
MNCSISASGAAALAGVLGGLDIVALLEFEQEFVGQRVELGFGVPYFEEIETAKDSTKPQVTAQHQGKLGAGLALKHGYASPPKAPKLIH